MHDGLQNMDGTLIPTADMTKIKQNVLMKTLELHYPMIQFLIIEHILLPSKRLVHLVFCCRTPAQVTSYAVSPFYLILGILLDMKRLNLLGFKCAVRKLREYSYTGIAVKYGKFPGPSL